MNNWRRALRSPDLTCTLWVALCFGLTSAVYLSWLNRLVALAGGQAADWLSMGAGYLMQAAGIGAVCWLTRGGVTGDYGRQFAIAAALFAVVSAPTLLTDSAAGVIGFGMAMNLLCGVIAGYYLHAVARRVDANRRSRVFGGGYAIATVAVGLLALIDGGGFLHSRYALLLYLPLAVAMGLIARRLKLLDPPTEAPAPAVEAPSVALACAVVFLLSMVKNLGFCFPSADIEAGMVPELSRLPYAVGLAAAGFINDRERKNGMVCTVAALILPFIMLGLTSEPVSATVCWGLDYLFYAFFTVFRVVLFLDLAAKTRRWALAPLGLLMGRLGDVAGTAVGMLLTGNRIALIAVTAAAFFPTIWLFYRQYLRLYEPEIVRQRSEMEVFDAFCMHNDLSGREREVFRMILDNHTNGEIAERLFITERTVKYHVGNLLKKTGCRSRIDLQKLFAQSHEIGMKE